MPAIPEFMLRKLYVPGSLKPGAEGFELQLNNTFAPVTLTSIGITAEDQRCEPQAIWLKLPWADELNASGITVDQPFDMPVNTVINLRVKAPLPHKRLVIHAETRQAGILQFSIPLQQNQSEGIKRLSLVGRLKHSFQSTLQARRVRRDPQHPSYHFTPVINWMNDPNGLIYWKGRVHLFYQYNPFGAVWGNMHWGHASSIDMLHWKHHPLALAPDPSGADAGGCFSGCAVDDEGTAMVLYTAVFPEVQCLARSAADDLVTWQKHPHPIISAPPQGMQVEGFRDPCVWKQDDEWRMAVGSGIHGEGGAVLLYASPNLTDWQYLGILYQKDPQEAEGTPIATMWECPAFFPLGEKWVLMVSVCNAQGPISTRYYLGDYRQDHFIPDGPARKLDHGAGACFYAPQTFLSANDERIMFGWLREARGNEEMKRAGWSGAMSLPRRLSLSAEGSLVCAPWSGIASLRGQAETLQTAGQLSDKLRGARLEALLRIQPDTAQWSGIRLATGKVPDEPVLIGWDPLNREVEVDCRQAGGVFSSLPLANPGQDEISLHIFVDGSVLEVFKADQEALSARFYVQEPRALRVQLLGDALAEAWMI